MCGGTKIRFVTARAPLQPAPRGGQNCSPSMQGSVVKIHDVKHLFSSLLLLSRRFSLKNVSLGYLDASSNRSRRPLRTTWSNDVRWNVRLQNRDQALQR